MSPTGEVRCGRAAEYGGSRVRRYDYSGVQRCDRVTDGG